LKDPWIITSLEMLTGITKSVILSLSFLMGEITKDEYYLIANSEEYYQKKIYGEVQNLFNNSKIFTVG